MHPQRRVEQHYAAPDLGERILGALAEAGHAVRPGELDALAPIDEMHHRGREATEELAAMGQWEPGLQVLDAGSGLGGSSRYLAVQHQCQVVGIDLTPDLCHAASLLSAALGIERTRFVRASVTTLPVADAAFDVVWTQHAQMNIPDKEAFYGELARALRPGGQLLFHDVFAGPAGAPHFPVPWADSETISSLVPPDRVDQILRRNGLLQRQWHDRTEVSLRWARKVLNAPPDPDTGSVGSFLMGPTRQTKMQNLERNLREGRIVLIQARYDKPFPRP